MRNSGTCFEVIGLRPHDHIGWVFDGPAEFYELAGRFLEDGTARRELLMLVADDPDPEAVHALSERCAADDLRVASIAEVYGASGVVDAEAQRATFMAVLDEALAGGSAGSGSRRTTPPSCSTRNACTPGSGGSRSPTGS